MARILTIIFIICMAATSVYAGHVDTYGIGSKGTAMGGAMTAGTDDPFSIYYNPAAMSRIKRPTFAIGAHIVDPNLEIKNYDVDESSPYPLPIADMSGDGIKDKSPLLKVPHFAYVHPINDKIAIGVAFYVPYGLDISWERNVMENPAAYNTFHSWYMREVITPSISYKVNDKLSLGFGVALGKSKAGSERVRYVPGFMKSADSYLALGYTPAEAAYVAAAYTALDGAQYRTEVEDDFNYSFNFGILYEFNEKWSAGLTFRSKSDTKMEGETDVTPDVSYWTNQNVDATVEIDTPNQLQIGVQYKPTPKWNLNFDITRTWWGAIEDYTVAFDEPFMATAGVSAGAEEEHYERNWKDTFQYRFGAEYKLNDMVDLRAGYYYDPTVVPNDTFDVQWPDSDKHIISAGAGFHFDRVTVDLVVQYIKITTIDIASGESENLNDSYSRPGIHEGEVAAKAEGVLMGYGVTVSYKF